MKKNKKLDINTLELNKIYKLDDPKAFFEKDCEKRLGLQLKLEFIEETPKKGVYSHLLKIRARIAPKMNINDTKFLLYIPNLNLFIDSKEQIEKEILSDTRIIIIY